MFPQHKMKENCLPQPNQNKKSLSPAHIKPKAKNGKEGAPKTTKIQNDIPVIPIKRQPHRPSKSSVQSQQHKHYNSPNPDISHQPENTSIHQFTFTQLLKQNQESALPSTSRTIISLHQPTVSPISDHSLKYRDSIMRKTPLTGYGMTQTNPSPIQDRELNGKDIELSDEGVSRMDKISSASAIAENKCNNQKSVSKSPVRLTNAHKLNNTPKLKGQSKSKNTKGDKTFKSILKTEEEGLPSNHGKQESINLLCSEKISKFIGSNPLEKHSSHKSNLQSTGIINLSQPQLGQKSPPLWHFGSNKLGIHRIISESDSIQEFQQQEHVPTPKDKIEQLKAKTNQISSYIESKLQSFNQLSFEQEINESFNPQLKNENICTLISTLTELSLQIDLFFNQIITKIQKTSHLFKKKIQEDIEVLQNSQSSLINWFEVQQSLQEQHFLENKLCQTQIIKLRLQNIEGITTHNQQQNFNSPEQRQEIGSINDDLNSLLQKLSLVDDGKEKDRSLGQYQINFYKTKTIELQKLLQYLDQLLPL